MANEEWRRIAVKKKTGKMLDVMLVMVNANRAENDALALYEMLGQMVREKWVTMKARGLVSDDMLGFDPNDVGISALVSEPVVYMPAEQVA
jgi:hypothetical protein